MRGDHWQSLSTRFPFAGPPPHARGSRPGPRRPPPRRRPTPACAGITLSESVLRDRAEAHPRMRGDHATPTQNSPMELGPPPHARGSRRVPRLVVHEAGPTPACAGITTTRSAAAARPPAHPRMRGDHTFEDALRATFDGPPPHARGSQRDHDALGVREGPTPACAGITKRSRCPTMAGRAHPRMRGDHIVVVDSEPSYDGPPPHARGSPRWWRWTRGCARPTPACAGITATCS